MGEREGVREGGWETGRESSKVVCASCWIHSLRQRWDKPGRRHSYLGQLLYFSTMEEVNSSYHMNTSHGINETSRTILIWDRR